VTREVIPAYKESQEPMLWTDQACVNCKC